MDVRRALGAVAVVAALLGGGTAYAETTASPVPTAPSSAASQPVSSPSPTGDVLPLPTFNSATPTATAPSTVAPTTAAPVTTTRPPSTYSPRPTVHRTTEAPAPVATTQAPTGLDASPIGLPTTPPPATLSPTPAAASSSGGGLDPLTRYLLIAILLAVALGAAGGAGLYLTRDHHRGEP